jgi:hypothetical protein
VCLGLLEDVDCKKVTLELTDRGKVGRSELENFTEVDFNAPDLQKEKYKRRNEKK